MEIPQNNHWNLKDIFSQESEKEQAIKDIHKLLENIQNKKGTLSTNAQNLYECYKDYEKLLEIFEKVYSYGMFQYHLDMADSKNIEAFKEVEKLNAIISEKTSFIVPEVTEISEEVIRKFIEEEPKLKRYEKTLNDIIDEKLHILSKEEESMLSSLSEVFQGCENAYDIFTNTEFKFPNIKDENGNEVELTDVNYSRYLASTSREVRKQAFESMYSLYKKHCNTITELYLTRVKQSTIISRFRKFKNSLEKAVHYDDASMKVYDSLINVVERKLPIHHKYIELKKELLKSSEMHFYDIYVNPFRKEQEIIPIEEARQTILQALAPLGKEYITQIDEAFSNNWIDAEEGKNKRGGAYSSGVYGVHPFILASYIGKERDVSTLAHELGHAMHSFYANRSQTVLNANYTIMVAEVASTVNELLLSHYIINKETDLNKKAILLYELLENIRATLIRQSMFAQFEKIVHEKVEQNENLTSDKLCEI